jgi:hypothetical protein
LKTKKIRAQELKLPLVQRKHTKETPLRLAQALFGPLNDAKL